MMMMMKETTLTWKWTVRNSVQRRSSSRLISWADGSTLTNKQKNEKQAAGGQKKQRRKRAKSLTQSANKFAFSHGENKFKSPGLVLLFSRFFFFFFLTFFFFFFFLQTCQTCRSERARDPPCRRAPSHRPRTA